MHLISSILNYIYRFHCPQVRVIDSYALKWSRVVGEVAYTGNHGWVFCEDIFSCEFESKVVPQVSILMTLVHN